MHSTQNGRRARWPQMVVGWGIAAGLSPLVVAANLCDPGCIQPESLLGMAQSDVKIQFPELEILKKRVVGPGRSVGRWRLANVTLGQQRYDEIIYTTGFRVSRIEYLSLASDADCRAGSAQEQAEAYLYHKYGDSLSVGSWVRVEVLSQSTVFSDQQVDAMLHVTKSPNSCATRIVFLPHIENDSSNL